MAVSIPCIIVNVYFLMLLMYALLCIKDADKTCGLRCSERLNASFIGVAAVMDINLTVSNSCLLKVTIRSSCILNHIGYNRIMSRL